MEKPAKKTQLNKPTLKDPPVSGIFWGFIRFFRIFLIIDLFHSNKYKFFKKLGLLSTVLLFTETTLKLTYLFFSHKFTKYCHSYVRVIWSFSGWVPFWAYNYLPINLSRPTPNQKYVSKCENRSSLKFIELFYQKIAVYPQKRPIILLFVITIKFTYC